MHVETEFVSYSLELCLRALVALGPGPIDRSLTESVVLVGHTMFQAVSSEASCCPIPKFLFGAVGPLAECRSRPSRV